MCLLLMLLICMLCYLVLLRVLFMCYIGVSIVMFMFMVDIRHFLIRLRVVRCVFITDTDDLDVWL